MFEEEEKDQIISDMQNANGIQFANSNKEEVYAAFLDKVQDNLRIVLTMSPVGDAFRTRFENTIVLEANMSITGAVNYLPW